MSSVEAVDRTAGETRDEAVEKIDFKMVTFALGGKDYGIDIMKVKEIAKFGSFTYVPNTPPFVAGVYNLRGDIISIIDLRLMFNLPVPDAEKKVEDGLILRLDNNQIGVIVDQIDKVVGISSSNIQPPHPIFGDINIKYISGVVENEGRLYIILDVERVFSQDHPQQADRHAEPAPMAAAAGQSPNAASKPIAATPAASKPVEDLTFIVETLGTFASFHVTGLNRTWVQSRFEKWQSERAAAGKDVQLANAEDAEAFLSVFCSPYTGEFWEEEYQREVQDLVSSLPNGPVSVWNPGCGKGFETYSLAVVLRRVYPERRIKIWASDKDLLSISTAPNLVFAAKDLPASHRPYIVEGTNGLNFSGDIKDLILFEYHDILHTNAVPEVDIILARDLLSFLSEADQQKVLEDFEEKVKKGGILVLGKNEKLPDMQAWTDRSTGSITAYTRQ